MIRAAWQAAHAWIVGRYVILPDHVHLFCAPATEEIPLTGWVHYWRSLVSRQWPRIAEQSIWQTGFWDTQLRRSERYDAKWDYVRNNPVRHGLVSKAEDWPYAGVLETLDW